ncbi:hypothetical protein LSCM1_01101 [Leishmania martiniquensis]|uniref:Uncharacterized protein n=1 Tax=Leishmania martiniquensis TaxID=1580590 RepID=A0A836K897_9TRYP|nr:hypothetical protein LSCM1_01101 [Leishmania martiniquensis]
MRSNAAKKSFRPPFKHAALPNTAAAAQALAPQLHRIPTFARHAALSFSDDLGAATLSLTSAPLAPDTTAAASKMRWGGDADTPPRDVMAHSLPRVETDAAVAGCAPSRRQLQRLIDARRAELAGTKMWALVADTLHWVTVSQAALQHLAETRAAGRMEQVFSELHIDPSSVLFSVEEGRFSHP